MAVARMRTVLAAVLFAVVIAPAAGGQTPAALFNYCREQVQFDARVSRETKLAVEWEVKFSSPVRLGPRENWTAWAHYFQPKQPAARPAPAVICLHTFGSAKARFCRRFIRLLLSKGVGGAYLELPFHMHRGRPGRDAARDFTRADTSHLAEVMRQSALDVRCLVDWLADRPEVDAKRIGIVGFSLGATVGALAYAVEPRLKAAALAGGGADPALMIWKSAILHRTRRALAKQGVTLEALRVILSAVDACTYATPERGNGVLLVNAWHDWVVPPACTWALWRAFGKPRIIWLNSGHFTMFAHPDKLNGELWAWLEYRFGMSKAYSPRGYKGQALKLAILRSRTLGPGGAVLWEFHPLGSRGRGGLEVGFVTPHYGIVGASVRIIDQVAVGVGVPIGKGPLRLEPYATIQVTF